MYHCGFLFEFELWILNNQISTSGFSTRRMKKGIQNGKEYGETFLKSRSTLHKDLSSDESDQELETASLNNRVLTDEELLKACGGRTAHK